PVDRTVSLLKLLILVGALGGLVVLPFSNQQLHSSALAEGDWKFAFGITLLLLFAHVARRRQASDGRSWCRGNAPLLGTYHVALFDECLSITTDHVALLVGYEVIANVESRRDCIRLSFDTGGLRGILLPFDDAAPQRPGPELLSFLQERLRERRTSVVAVEPLGQHQQPLLEA